jgi:hypothetical protein
MLARFLAHFFRFLGPSAIGQRWTGQMLQNVPRFDQNGTFVKILLDWLGSRENAQKSGTPG